MGVIGKLFSEKIAFAEAASMNLDQAEPSIIPRPAPTNFLWNLSSVSFIAGCLE